MDNVNIERGTIMKISVENFVTYDNAVIKPGRNLNVIIGPNGTGKSTIVCAIVLGLGGKPKLIGRALHVAEYVKSGREKARIDIELNNPVGKNWIVTRIFTADNQTTWMLNGKTVNAKEVEAFTASLNIQVDNLCQFLPQDKVQDFSKMNAQDLLENTERSVGDPILLEYHTKLKDYRKRHVLLQEQIANKSTLLERQTQKHDRLKEIVGGIKERTAIKKKIRCLKQKKAWLLYDQSRRQLIEAKKVRDAAFKEMNQLLQQMKPIDKVIAKMKSDAEKAERSVNSEAKQTLTKARNLTNIVQSLSSHAENIQEMEKALAIKIQTEITRDQEIAIAQQQKSKLENDLERIISEFGDEQSLLEKQRQILPLIEKHRNFTNQVANEMHNYKQQEDKIRRTIRAEETELQSVKDVEKQRLLLLKQKSMDAYKGVLWLRENSDKFSTIIHEPMLLKINVKSANYSKYFEHILPTRDLYAFMCESKQDMNLLMKYLRDNQRLQINCVHSDPDKNVNMSPKIPIETIARYGFENYLSSLVDAPQTILKYLISMYRINNIPIGNENVESSVDYVPNTLTCFYSRNNCYSVSTSKYSGQKSSRVSRVSGTGALSIILDATKLDGIQERLRSLNEKKKLAAHKVVDCEKKHAEAEEKMKELRAQRGECQHHIEQIKTVKSRINIVIKKINDLQTQRTSIEEIKEQNNRDINDIIVKQMKVFTKYNEALEEFIEISKNTAYAKLEMKLYQRVLVVKQNEYREIKDKCTKAERTVRDFDSDLQPLRAEAKRMYEEALNSTNNIGPQDKDFEKLNKAFSKLPPTVDEINDELKVAHAKVFCLGDTPDGDNILQEFEKVKLDVEKLRQSIDSKSAELENLIREMEDIRDKWMPPLHQLVENINQNFSSYLASMDCAGEVSISHGENIMDFEQYGIKIKVKFRDTDELQELTRTHQSGGERAVTTAIYMIALQELSTVPFRCVDEINQGMDATYERRVFELIVDITAKPNGSQYFLLTPKLLSDILYKETVTVHCVFNGPFALSHHDFDMDDYCEQLVRSKSAQ